VPVPLIPCRHRETGAEARIPETALYLFSDFERIDQDSEAAAMSAADSTDADAGKDDTATETAKETTEQPAPSGRRTSKAATSATTKED
jgi:hypothetical protein